MKDSVERPTPWWVYVPPPPLFVVAFLAGVKLQEVLPLTLAPGLVVVARGAGIAALLAGVGLLSAAPVLFLLRRTTIIPHATARALVTDGPYRLTRNPMYLGLTLAHIGLALVLQLVWPLVLLGFPLVILSTQVIPFEEARLTRLFGEEFSAYARRVRRWI